MKLQVVIPAAGMGERLGMPLPKALVEINGQALIRHTLQRLAPFHEERPAIVLYPENFHDDFVRVCEPMNVLLVAGGKERQQSVQNALSALEADTEIAILHDAARPFVPLDAVHAAVEACKQWGAATLAVPVSDTILAVNEECLLTDTPDRKQLWACQTPQIFLKEALLYAHGQAAAENRQFTDDASLVRHYGGTVKIVSGHGGNFKITTAADLAYAAFIMQKESP